MGHMKANSIRARVRAEMIDEIKTIARRHLASEGANLSLRAVARDLGVVSSAIYRYFASRDELLTALILDAYNAIGAAVEQREREVVRTDLVGRWMAVCHAVRDWALAHPHEYALVYGSPVPGYQAPADTVAAATRAVTVLVGILRDGAVSGVLRDDADERLPVGVDVDVARLAAAMAPEVPPPVLARGLTAWVQLFGMINFEVFGQLNNTIDHRDEFFGYQMRAQAALIGL